MKKISKYLLVLICLLFITTRLYKISEIPPAVYWDEASIGYNAYSIAQTGKDEWGRGFPLHFQAFGEYKLPVYIYTTSLFIKVFGLSEFSVRLPSVLFSLGVVILTYFLAKKISNNEQIGLLSSFLISISPWFFIFSRTGYESTAGLFFCLAAILLWLNSNTKLFLLVPSVISFLLSMYSYNSFRIIAPLSIFYLIFVSLRSSKYNIKNAAVIILVGLIFVLGIKPIATNLVYGGDSRLLSVGIFNQKEKLEILKNFLANYSSHFSPKFLLTQGDANQRSQQKGFGQIYLLDIPFLLIGFFYLLRKKNLTLAVPIYLLIISIIPAAITRESPHALRTIAVAPIIGMISAFGIYQTNRKIKNKLFLYLIVLIFLIFFINYFYHFTSDYNKEAADDWQYSYKKIFTDYANQFNRFDKIIVSDRGVQPYIFALFYLKYNTDKFRAEVKYNTSIRRTTSLVQSFDKFVFTDVDYHQLPKGKSLIFTHPTDKMDEIKWKEIITNPDGSIGGYVYEYQK